MFLSKPPPARDVNLARCLYSVPKRKVGHTIQLGHALVGIVSSLVGAMTKVQQPPKTRNLPTPKHLFANQRVAIILCLKVERPIVIPAVLPKPNPLKRRHSRVPHISLTHTIEDLIYLRVGGVPYIYCLDRALHSTFMKTFNHRPGRALNFIKSRCRWWEKEK
jgi:hypothetical protein